MTKEEYFHSLQDLLGEDFGKLNITLSLPRSVMKRIAERYLKTRLEQYEKRLTAKNYISATKDSFAYFVGKTYSSAVSKVELEINRRKLMSYNTAKKNVNAYTETTFSDLISKIPENVSKEFDEQYHSSQPKFQELYSDKQQIALLKKFIEKSIKKLEKMLEKASMLKDSTAELKKLSGVLLQKQDDAVSGGVPRAMKTPEYQNILANLVTMEKVFDELDKKYNDYLAELNKLNAGEKNKNIRNRISELRRLVSQTEESLNSARVNYEAAKAEKKRYEDRFYEKEKEKIKSKQKNIIHNKAKDVLDDYSFSIDGAEVQKGTMEAKEINIIVNEFMSRFKNEIDLTLKEMKNRDAQICEYIKNISDKMEDDFGVYLNSSRTIQRAIDARIKELNAENENDDVSKSLVVTKALFKSNYDDLRKKFAQMDIDIKNIGRKKAKN